MNISLNVYYSQKDIFCPQIYQSLAHVLTNGEKAKSMLSPDDGTLPSHIYKPNVKNQMPIKKYENKKIKNMLFPDEVALLVSKSSISQLQEITRKSLRQNK